MNQEDEDFTIIEYDNEDYDNAFEDALRDEYQ